MAAARSAGDAGAVRIPLSEVLPEYREYERTSTTVANAYLTPLLSRYAERLGTSLERWASRPSCICCSPTGAWPPWRAPGRGPSPPRSRGRAGGVTGASRLSASLGIPRRDQHGYGRHQLRRMPDPGRPSLVDFGSARSGPAGARPDDRGGGHRGGGRQHHLGGQWRGAAGRAPLGGQRSGTRLLRSWRTAARADRCPRGAWHGAARLLPAEGHPCSTRGRPSGP